MIGNKTRTILVGIVTSAWVVNFSASFISEDYKPSEAVNGVFMLVVGAIFAAGARGNGKDGEGG